MQGDSQKLLGYQPIDETMDRDFRHKIPEIQVRTPCSAIMTVIHVR